MTEYTFIQLTCAKCAKEFLGPKPEYCCDGRECGCMGLPIYPDSVYCEECLNEIFKKLSL